VAACSSGQAAPGAAPATTGAPRGSAHLTATPTAVSSAPSRPSSGCRTASTTPPGTGEITETMTSGGVTRTYLRYVPPGVDPTHPLPLVIDIHGLGSNMTQQQDITQFEALAATQHFVVLTPDAVKSEWNIANRRPNADIDFLTAMLDQVEGQVCVDTARVYSTGYSDGGLMSSALACQVSDRIAAVGLVSGIQHGPACHPVHPMPMIVFWGKKDLVLPFYGGLGVALQDLLSGKPVPAGLTAPTAPPANDQGFPPVPDVVASWATTNGCPADAVTIPSGSDVTQHLYAPCQADTSMRFYVVSDGGHAWPGSKLLSAVGGAGNRGSIIGFTTMQIDATQLIWSFFRGYALPAT
jgi:polyhydroxybutyrate depolymerase